MEERVMSPQTVVAMLLASFSPNSVERKRAEEQIASLTEHRGSVFVLLQVAAEGSVQREARQAAAITLKNMIKRKWEQPDALFASDSEKASARSEILSTLLAETEAAVRDQLAECVNEVSIKDYPVTWPELLPTLVSALVAQQDAASVHNALLATRKLCKRFEFKSRDAGARLPLEDIVLKTFELLRSLLANFVSAAAAHPEAATLAKVILKIFWSCTQYALPEAARRQPDYVIQWFDLVKASMECGTTVAVPSTRAECDALAASPVWKLKKWATQISARFLQRYGRAKYMEESGRAFAETFAARQAPALLESCFGLLAASARGCYVSPRVRQLCFTYVDTAVEIGALYKLMRPHLDFILFEACLPTMCASLEDIEQFETDPQEFVRKAHDPLEDFLEPRAAAMNLVAGLVRTRPKDVFDKLLGRLSEVLAAYEATPHERRTLDAVRSKDGALSALGALSDELKKKKKYAAHVDSILAHHVLPEIVGADGALRSVGGGGGGGGGEGSNGTAAGVLRSRACWTLQQFATHACRLPEARVAQCVHAALAGLNDAKLPVRVEAAGAVRQLLAASDHPGVDVLMRPALPQILDACFQIMGDIGSDDVVQALEIVIDKFGDEIAPYAVALARNLVEAFSAYAAVGEDDDEASMAAAQCVEAMAATLNSISSNENNVYSQVEPYLVPVLVRIFGSRGGELVEYFENAIEVLTYLTFSSDVPLSRDLWHLFELLVDAFHEWAYDYIPDLVRPFDNFVSRDPDTFLTLRTADGRRYVDKLSGVAARLLAPENLHRTCERDAVKATYILLSIVHNCKGRVDDSVAAYARLVATVLPLCLGPKPRDPDAPAPAPAPTRRDDDRADRAATPWMFGLATALVTVWSSLLWYDAGLSLKAATSTGPPDAFFAAWFNVTDSGRLNALAAKCAVLGFAAVLALDDPTFALLKPHALAGCVSLVGDDESDDDDDLDANQRGADDGFEDDDDDDDDDRAVADDDEDDAVAAANFDEDVDDPEDEAYMAAITNAKDENGTSMRDAITSFARATDFNMDDDVLCYTSPIDDEDEHVLIFNAFQAAQARGELEAIVNRLPHDLQARVPEMFSLAERRAREHAEHRHNDSA
ncbi:hypothetical protein CTAYLR_000825 [Chrysophaeum taylorii]|uniref:Importin N-terminal domain-containing protein n=1 Tax=Chrysophaeum taylorii TaxID=2483200 RepID=A0AAD7XS84_9STRA|nr:hypothetical protein CTAYLR_000825 [Chrysophaeum taylorii]